MHVRDLLEKLQEQDPDAPLIVAGQTDAAVVKMADGTVSVVPLVPEGGSLPNFGGFDPPDPVEWH